jgi:hypothetical protein
MRSPKTGVRARLALAVCLATTAANAQAWSLVSSPTAPQPRSSAAMSADPSTGAIVLFGGSTGAALLGDTWTFAGSQWQNVATGIAPSPRSGAAIAHDRPRQRFVLFGGQNAAGARLNDTWTFDGANWAQVLPASAPSPRTRAAMCYDLPRDRMVLVGGLTASGPSSETWEWNGANWQLRTGLPLTARSGAAIAYDAASQSVTVFGGLGTAGPLADTCVLLASSWLSMSLPGPAAREGASATYDPVQSRVLLVGGRGTGSTLLTDAWSWDGTAWTSTAAPTTARADAGLAYDTRATRAVEFGGLGASGALGDTQVRFSFATAPQPLEWRRVANTGPAARTGAAMAFDSARGQTILFGGFWITAQPFPPGGSASYDTYADCWSWNGSAWSPMPLGPPARSGAAMCFDSARGRIVLFGGSRESTATSVIYRGDTWEWSGTAWSQVASSGPPAASGSAMAFDSARNVTVLFGGHRSTGPHDETWEWNGVAWARRTPPASPQALFLAAMDYDPLRGRTVLHGGLSTAALLDTTWEWDGANWTQMPGPNPPAMAGHRAHFDAQRAGVVLISQFALRTWDRISGTWVERTELQPEPRVEFASTYDATRQRLVMFGGRRLLSQQFADQQTPMPTDTWECGPGIQPLSNVAGTAIEYGTPCLAEPTRFAAFPASRPAVGRELTGIAWGLASIPVGWVALGLSDRVSVLGPLPAPLAAIGMPTCSLLQSADITLTSPGTAIASGTMSFRIAVPNDPAFLGLLVYGQAWGPSENGALPATISNAIEWRIGSH